MFYCDECAKENDYPESIGKSYGRCEICGVGTICSDRKLNFKPKDKNEDWEGKKESWVPFRTKRVALYIVDDCKNCPNKDRCVSSTPDNGIPNDCTIKKEVAWCNDFDNPENQLCVVGEDFKEKFLIRRR